MIRKLSIVTYDTSGMTDYEAMKLPGLFTDGTPIVFMGEIPNMPGHGVFMTENHTYIGYKISNFVELNENDIKI